MSEYLLKRTSVVDDLVDSLRDRILSGELGSGPLREVEISSQYGAARHTVRSAFQVLTHEGLLTRHPHRGVVVTELEASGLRDLFGVRIAIEAEAVRVLQTTRADLGRAREQIAALEQATDMPWSDLIAADLAIHHAIVECCGNQRLSAIHRSLLTELRLAMAGFEAQDSRRLSIVAEHWSLIDGIESLNPAAIDDLIRHLENSRDELEIELIGRAATDRPITRS